MQRYTSQNSNDFPSVIGVYKIFFDNGKDKCYIGSSAALNLANYRRGINTRWKVHLSNLRRNKHHSIKLQHAYNKYGEHLLIFELLETCDKGDIIDRENYYIDKYDSVKNGYNILPAAGSCLGYIQPKELIDRIQMTKRLKSRSMHEKKVLDLYDTCKNCAEVSRTLDITYSVVRQILKDNNISSPKNGGYRIKKIYGYTLNGDFVGEWESAKDCANSLGFKSPCTISHVAAKTVLSYNKMWFSYEFLSKQLAQQSILARVLDGKNRMSEGTKTREQLKKIK